MAQQITFFGSIYKTFASFNNTVYNITSHTIRYKDNLKKIDMHAMIFTFAMEFLKMQI